MPLPRFSIRRMLFLTAVIAVVVRLALRKPSGDEAEFLQILIGTAGLLTLFVCLYSVLWFAGLAVCQHLAKKNVERATHRKPASDLDREV